MVIEGNLKTHTLKSIKWVSLGILLPKFISPLTSIILASILLPSDFGTVSICITIVSFLTLIQGLGLSDFLLKSSDNPIEISLTAFWTNLIMSVILYLTLLISAPLLASAWDGINDQDYIEKARALLQKKKDEIKSGTSPQRYQKCYNYGLSKGYESSLVRELLKPLFA
jgi:O-antigen/teichoic acid export membrane protein